MCRKANHGGVQRGMSKVQAEAICPAYFRSRHMEEENAAFEAALRIAERFSPRVEDIASPCNNYRGANQLSAVLLIDSSGTRTLFGAAESYTRKLHSEFEHSGFSAGVASAPNADAALMLARSDLRATCANHGNVQGLLADLSVSLLPCEPRTRDVLSRWGIRTLSQLAALPETALVSRLGQQGRRLQLLARGQAEHLLVPEEPAFTLSATTTLDAPLEQLDSLLFVVSPMLENMLRTAVNKAYAIRSVRLTLQLEFNKIHTLEVRPAVPVQNRDLLLKLLNLQLQTRPPCAGVVSVNMEAEPAQPQIAQRGLFQAQFPEPDKLDLLLARLCVIAGGHNVGSPALANSHCFDAFTMSRFQPRLGNTRESSKLSVGSALRMFRPEQSVRVICRNQQPSLLFLQQNRFSVTACAGPWHSSGSWWDNRAWHHDMWDVAISEPSHVLRLRYIHSTKQWFAIGVYD